MSETRTNMYEGLFLFPVAATADLKGTVEHLKEILAKADARVLSLRKWDERKLAYEIKGNKRGVYFLVYFEASRDRLDGITRDCNLSERILRAMMIRADHLTSEQAEAADGQAELADEIKARSQEDAAPSTESATVTTTSSAAKSESAAPTESTVAS